MSKIKLILGASILIFSAVTNAKLISRDYLTHGDDLITFDTKTKLQWLDVTVTQGMGYQDVINSDFIKHEGFRFADWREVLTLFSNAGITNSCDFGLSGAPCGEVDAVNNLIDLIGATATSTSGFRFSSGWHSPYFVPQCGIFGPCGDVAQATYLSVQPDSNYTASCCKFGSINHNPNPLIGNHLVRVPEPSAIALLLTGLLGLAFVRRRVRE